MSGGDQWGRRLSAKSRESDIRRVSDFSQMNSAYTNAHAEEDSRHDEYVDPFSYDLQGNKVDKPVKK